jgi:hypothetical protein
MVTVGLLALLVGVSASMVASARRSRARTACAANLHAIGNAFNLYLTDNADIYPAPSAEAQWEDLLRPFIPRKTFQCPADAELFTALGSSYNWRDTGDPATTLAGVPAVRVVRQSAVLAFDSFPGWHAQKKIQVLKADNSQELMTQSDFFRDMQTSATGH